MSPFGAMSRSIGPSNRGPPAGAPLAETRVRAPVVGFTLMIAPAPEAVMSATRMSPLASRSIPLGLPNDGPPAGLVLLEISVRVPVARSTLITLGTASPATIDCSATSTSPFEYFVMPHGVSKAGLPVGELFSLSTPRVPVAGSTVVMPPLLLPLGGVVGHVDLRRPQQALWCRGGIGDGRGQRDGRRADDGA